jgi:broad specificity phosphatase PhoE
MSSVSQQLPLVYLARHGDTAWTVLGRHTGLIDLPLNERGEQNARRLGKRLKGLTFVRVFTSPLQRASRTCELAGFSAVANVDHDLVEWNYGAYDGKTNSEIHEKRPGWELFRDGCPGGESVADVAERADRVIGRIRGIDGCVLLFSSRHFLRVFAARWLGLDPAAGRYFLLDTAALCIVGYEHGKHDPVIRLWNDCPHEGDSGGGGHGNSCAAGPSGAAGQAD